MKTLLLTFLCIPIIGFISCQSDSTADDLQDVTEVVKQNGLEPNTPVVKDEQTRLEEKFPPSTNAIAVEERVYFHTKPDETTILKSFIVSGQNCIVEKVENGFGYVSFDYKGKTTKGWLNLKYLDTGVIEVADKSSIIQFSLNLSNKREAPATSIRFLADYKIELKEGNTIIAVFEDSGEGFLSNEKNHVSIRTAVPSERTYSFEKSKVDEVIVIKHFFFSDMDIDEDTWRKTYKKDKINNWKLVNCEGDCN